MFLRRHSHHSHVYLSTISIDLTYIHPTERVKSTIRLSIDLDLDRDGALLRLQHNQVVVVSKVLNGSINKLRPGNDLQRNQRRHEVDFAVGQAVKNQSQHNIPIRQFHQQEREKPLTSHQCTTCHPCQKQAASSAAYSSASHPQATSPEKTRPDPGRTLRSSG